MSVRPGHPTTLATRTSYRKDWRSEATTLPGAVCAAAQPVSSHDDHSLIKVDNHHSSS
jgi:hypothetical protein